MANKYKGGKFNSPFGKAQVENDANKAQAALSDDYDRELSGLNDVINSLENKLDKIDKELDKLKAHSDTGVEARTACTSASKKIRTVKTNLSSSLKALSKAINVEEKAERRRMRAWINKKMAEEANDGKTAI